MSPEQQLALYQSTLRDIAATVVRARARTPLGSFTLPPGVGEDLLSDLELHLSRLIVLAAVPPPPPRALPGPAWADYPRDDL